MTQEPPPFAAISPEDFRRMREVFESALEQPPAERRAFVARAYGSNLGSSLKWNGCSPRRRHRIRSWIWRSRWAPTDLDPAVFATNFDIVEAIGYGGMGEVYRARDGRLDRDVAIKILRNLRPTRIGSHASSARLKSSVRSTTQISPPSMGSKRRGMCTRSCWSSSRDRRWPNGVRKARFRSRRQSRSPDKSAGRARSRPQQRHRASRSETREHQSSARTAR